MDWTHEAVRALGRVHQAEKKVLGFPEHPEVLFVFCPMDKFDSLASRLADSQIEVLRKSRDGLRFTDGAFVKTTNEALLKSFINDL